MAELDLSQYSSDAKSPVKTKPEPKPKRRAPTRRGAPEKRPRRKNKLDDDDDDDDTSSTSGTRRTSARTRKKTTHRECACSIKTNVVRTLASYPDRRPETRRPALALARLLTRSPRAPRSSR